MHDSTSQPSTTAQPRKTRRTLAILGITLAAILGGVGWMASGPDYEIRFEREVPSAQSPEELGVALRWITSWPQWHHMTADAQALDILNRPYALSAQEAVKGARVRFGVEPKQMKRRRFLLEAVIEDYVPAKKLTVRLVSDSSGRVTELFDPLLWEIELIPGTPHGAPGIGKNPSPTGTRIVGRLIGRTHHWRSRLFGRLSQRILMHQLFYPNLIGLAELKQPQTPASMPQALR